MKIAKQTSRKTKIIITTAVVLLAGAGYGVAAYLNDLPPFAAKSEQNEPKENQINTKPATDDEKKAGSEAKKSFIERHENDTSDETTPDTPHSTQAVNVTLTSVNQSGTILQIRSIIDGLDNDGACKLTLSKSGQQSVVQEAGTQVMTSYTVCKGFDVDTASLAKGDWTITIDYSGNQVSGSAAGKVNIK